MIWSRANERPRVPPQHWLSALPTAVRRGICHRAGRARPAAVSTRRSARVVPAATARRLSPVSVRFSASAVRGMEVVGQLCAVRIESIWRPQHAIGTGPAGAQGRRHCRHPELYLGGSHPRVERLGSVGVFGRRHPTRYRMPSAQLGTKEASSSIVSALRAGVVLGALLPTGLPSRSVARSSVA